MSVNFKKKKIDVNCGVELTLQDLIDYISTNGLTIPIGSNMGVDTDCNSHYVAGDGDEFIIKLGKETVAPSKIKITIIDDTGEGCCDFGE